MNYLSRKISLYSDTHTTCGTSDETHCRLYCEAVEVWHLVLCDCSDLIPSYLCYLLTVRPLDADIKVKVGDRVKAVESVLAIL